MPEGIQGGILHGASLSPFVRKVRAVLAVKAIDYELVNVMPGAMEPVFLAKSPLSKIPVWEEEGWALPDSSAICAYLERRVPSPAIYPSDARAFATSLFWEEYSDTRAVESGTPIFFQRIVRERVFKEQADEEIVRRHLEEVLPPALDQMEALFIGRDRANPADLTIGNLAVWSPFVNLDHAGFELDKSIWPGLAAFVETMNAHPMLAKLVEEERAVLATF
jgi:glutathione S-transferase